MNLIPYLAVLLFVFAVALLWLASRRQRSLGLPAGRIVSTDTGAWGKVTQPLYDRITGLTGRPDYLIQQGNLYIPVEVKSTRISAAPYDSHIFQLAAYCRLVHATYGERPPHGILHYANRTFEIDYTPELENALFDLLEEIREQDRKKEPPDRSHASAARCSRCGYRHTCDQVLRG